MESHKHASGEFDDSIHDNKEVIQETEHAILLVKPDGIERKVQEYEFEKLLLGLVDSTGLSVESSTTVQLTEEQVRGIYPILDVPDEQFGEQWKHDLIDHITSSPVHAYILAGDGVDAKLKIIKDYVRNTLTDRSTVQGKVVENLLHVADPEEYERTKEILFGG